MPELPAVRAVEVIRALERGGFSRKRQRGSHVFLAHESSGRSTSVPLHFGDIPRSLLHAIIKQAGLTVGEFLDLLRE